MPFDPLISLIEMYPKKNVGKAIQPNIFIALLFTVVEKHEYL